IAEIVHHHGTPSYRWRQLRLNIVYLAAKFVPDLRDCVFVIPIFDTGGHDGHPARGFRLYTVELTELLAGTFDRVADLLRDLFGAGRGVGSKDQRFLEGKSGTLKPPKIPVAHKTADDG